MNKPLHVPHRHDTDRPSFWIEVVLILIMLFSLSLLIAQAVHRIESFLF